MRCLHLLHLSISIAAFNIQVDEKFQAFNGSDFGTSMIQGIVETQIAGFYTDLSTSIGDFEQDFNEPLTFNRYLQGRAIYRYHPATPMYHLKQNQFIKLQQRIQFTLQKSNAASNCAGLFLEKNVHGFVRDTVEFDKLKTEDPDIISFRHGLRIWIPKDCAMYVIQMERSF